MVRPREVCQYKLAMFLVQDASNIRVPYLTHNHPNNILAQPSTTSYPLELTDHKQQLRDTPFNITVQWNWMPTVGETCVNVTSAVAPCKAELGHVACSGTPRCSTDHPSDP